MSRSSPITTHVLDTAAGQPAAGVAVVLKRLGDDGRWHQIAEGVTNDDGRLTTLLAKDGLAEGRYRLSYATGDYFQSRAQTPFYPQVSVEFQVADAKEHYHIPLLLSPFGYSTYRGS
jgi:5-hydroxyisourate hydrolase